MGLHNLYHNLISHHDHITTPLTNHGNPSYHLDSLGSLPTSAGCWVHSLRARQETIFSVRLQLGNVQNTTWDASWQQNQLVLRDLPPSRSNPPSSKLNENPSIGDAFGNKLEPFGAVSWLPRASMRALPRNIITKRHPSNAAPATKNTLIAACPSQSSCATRHKKGFRPYGGLTSTNGCGRLRTVTNGERKRNHQAKAPSTPPQTLRATQRMIHCVCCQLTHPSAWTSSDLSTF